MHRFNNKNNAGNYLVASPKDDSGNPIVDTYLITVFSNSKAYAFPTDKNGQIRICTNGLAPKVYAATVIFAGNDKYAKSTATVKITVKKATPKLTAKAKTFKKYTVVLKTSK